MVMTDANTMIRCIIGDDQNKIAEFQQIRLEQNIIYALGGNCRGCVCPDKGISGFP